MALRGHIDHHSHHRVDGWAEDPSRPGETISLILTIDGVIVGRCLAERFRQDLAKAGIGEGRHAFVFRLTAPLSPFVAHEISVRREDDGAHLAQSPVRLEPATAFDKNTRDAIARFLGSPADLADAADRIKFLSEQLDRLRSAHATLSLAAAERSPHHNDPKGIQRPRALVIDERMPVPGRDAGSNALLSHMTSLQRLGFDVVFVPADLAGDPAAVEALGIACYLRPIYGSIEEVLQRHRGGFALVYLHRANPGWHYAPLVRQTQSRARLIYSVADLHGFRLARQAEVEERPDLKAVSARYHMMELTAGAQADAVITHSQAEAVWLRRYLPPGRVHVVPWTVPVQPTTIDFAGRHGFAFIGSYTHAPNVDAARWLVEAVVPALSLLDAKIECLLVGSDLPNHISALANESVKPVGWVPDLASIFDRIRLTVAPLAYGAGVKGKVLDSMAAGIPCVCSPTAAEGLELPAILLELVATTPAQFAQTIQRLHDDEALNHACSEAGLAYIRTHASEENVDVLMKGAVGYVDGLRQ